MLFKISPWMGLIGVGVTIAIVQPNIANAKSSVEIGETAKTITVSITEPSSVGSGVVIQRQGDIYTVLTAAHVVKNKATFKITTPDDRSYEVIGSSIRFAPGSIDLAIVTFKSPTKYPTAKLGNCNVLKAGMDLYVGGFPGQSRAITQPIFVFREGKVSANSNKVLENGYSLVYSNDTLPGMSGGAVMNSAGELVAIHGRGDKDENNAKTGFNLGIPVNRFATVASNMGVNLETQVAPISRNTTPKADDYIVLALQSYRQQDYRGSLTNFDRALLLDPNNTFVYAARANLKYTRLRDIQGSLADYNRAIAIDPNNAVAYTGRGVIKTTQLRDDRGALTDFDRALQLDPNNAVSYATRGLLKYTKLRDRSGAITDMKQAAKLFKQQGNLSTYQQTIELLKKWQEPT